jgi:uncharacterized protein
MIIDANMHFLPENLFDDEELRDAFINALPREYGVHGYLTQCPGKDLRQIIIEEPKGYVNLNYAEDQYNDAVRLKDMDALGIDKAILRIPVWQEWLDLETSKKLNTIISEHMKRNPGRFVANAVVPPWGTKECLKEIERCINDLGFSGVQMSAHYGKLYLDEEEFKPHFKFINELNVPVVVHHTPMPVDYGSILKYNNQRRQYGRCLDQGTAVGRELFSGMFEEFPNLKLIHSMLGGAFFAFANMLAPKCTSEDTVARFAATDSAKISQFMENNIFFDTSGAVQWGKDQLECAVKVIGADHILYGSSYPIMRHWVLQGVDFVKSLDIDEKDKSLILGENAVRLFNIK